MKQQHIDRAPRHGPVERMRGFVAAPPFPDRFLDWHRDEARAESFSLSIAVAFCLVYLLVGLVGHDPWKQDEAYVFGIIQSLLETGDWVVPTLTGAPFMEKPPLFYIAAAATARLFSPWLPLHDGARLASGLLTGLSILCTGLTARFVWGSGNGRLAAMAMCATIGLLLHSHMMLTDVALLAGFSVAMLGLVTLRGEPFLPGLLLGIGIGISFLAKGLLGPGVIVVATLALPFVSRAWRTRAVARNLVAAAVAAAPWVTIWPLALYHRSPELFGVWLWDNNIGRFLGFSVDTLGAAAEPGFWWITIPWFTFPALPLALHAVLGKGARGLRDSGQLALVALLMAFVAVLGASASARASYALPIIAPLAALAAPSVAAVSRRSGRALIFLAIVLLLPIAAYAWAVWIAAVGTGSVPDWPLLAQYLPMDQVLKFHLTDLVGASLLLAGFVWVARSSATAAIRPVGIWAAAFLLAWGTLTSLWMPWIDRARSYRSVFEDMASHLPAHSCLAADRLGESERAMLRYTTGIMPELVGHGRAPACANVLVQGVRGKTEILSPYRLQSVAWEGARPGDSRERFWLLRPTIDLAANGAPPRGHE